MHIEHRKSAQNRAKFFVEAVLGEFDLAHVKLSNTTYFEVFVDDLLPVSERVVSGYYMLILLESSAVSLRGRCRGSHLRLGRGQWL